MPDTVRCLMCGGPLLASPTSAGRRLGDVPDFCPPCVDALNPVRQPGSSAAVAVAGLAVKALGALGRSLARRGTAGTRAAQPGGR